MEKMNCDEKWVLDLNQNKSGDWVVIYVMNSKDQNKFQPNLTVELKNMNLYQ